MLKIEFTEKGTQDLRKLPKDLQTRIIRKLQFFVSQENPLVFSKPLTNQQPITHRFRVGDYRIAFYIVEKIIYVDKIKHRKEVYYLEIKLAQTGEK